MPSSKLSLEDAIVAERAAAELLDTVYHRLNEKMTAYQRGLGPPPTENDFNEWRVAADQVVKRRAMESGLGDLS